MNETQRLIEEAFEGGSKITPSNAPKALKAAVQEALALLDSGKKRIAEKQEGQWRIEPWLKKAVLLYFRIQENVLFSGGFTHFFDKVPLKFEHWQAQHFAAAGLRVVPDACVRYGAYIAPRVVLMPCYVNIGAYVGEGSLVDTWATIGSCAQIGKRVHISGGVGIGGVLEPLQNNPTIIEDDCFIGARSEVVEGVIIEEGAVLSMGVYIGQSTKIYDRTTGKISRGRVPRGAVVVPGSLPAKDGTHSTYCAVIVKTVDSKTREKIGINELLREV
ncbi:MAG: 2,3,4,5-tetrahydropyridine-2,6-dicarboxylate N-succinyltransferase [Gammaproteobacteria bacterium]|nr:2,3,4,5-tetrahydropyridine-2,6-dicarboxylate N-succinyltransferase [Gammaproteobacteria bacterium]